ncbi:hypothetical protein E2C01_100254 [Portunus trituberculatus]|uniref:Uncharacterized protein n=1 Tax=Portunus trituberculatus TaxID=210409 RepID=A0A5B7K6B5_PORTR|nr:hypothetical protein [Portunus trituberculatus]
MCAGILPQALQEIPICRLRLMRKIQMLGTALQLYAGVPTPNGRPYLSVQHVQATARPLSPVILSHWRKSALTP